MQRVSEPISLSLSSRGRKAVATTCFFSTFRVFCRYKIFVRRFCALFSFFLSLSLSLSLSRMDEEETTRGDDDKKTDLYPYEVLVESFDYTIVACTFEPMMSVNFRPKRERERREESFYFCIQRPLLWVKSENKQQQQQQEHRERESESRMRVLVSSWR